MTGYFFGSFDPPHIGHVNVVTAALNSGYVDEVIVVPAYKSVWKNTETKYEYRYDMCIESFSNIPRVKVSSVEYAIYNGSPLPTHVVLSYIKEKINEDFYIVTSSETFSEIPRWENGWDILDNNKFLVVDLGHFNAEYTLGDKDSLIFAPDIIVCSTNIRNKVKEGKITQPFLNNGVADMITKLKLYS